MQGVLCEKLFVQFNGSNKIPVPDKSGAYCYKQRVGERVLDWPAFHDHILMLSVRLLYVDSRTYGSAPLKPQARVPACLTRPDAKHWKAVTLPPDRMPVLSVVHGENQVGEVLQQ